MDGWKALDYVVAFSVGVGVGLLLAAIANRPPKTTEPISKE